MMLLLLFFKFLFHLLNYIILIYFLTI